ncbi:MAG TPA: carboxypeptidase regulatory-like domain-containing protein, partial [Bacteroidota bacterium]|nr:carboxypeptidase regulatory-like domain-containing protein [Bacteroidota bacterium]
MVPIADLPAGVLQATLFDGNEIQRAERLVFVNKPKQLKIEISSDKERYLPREKVELTIKVADERGVPYPANLSLAVVDDKLISFADDKSGNIVSKMLLEPDLKEKVDEPNFYFDQKEPKADEALDYLMMTRGWRRFEWKEVLNEEPPAIRFQPERALIAGTVIDASTHQPIADASVTITGTNQTVRTDSNGTFSIRNCDLSSQIYLSVEKDQFSKSSIMISDYNENVRLQLRSVESELSAQQNLNNRIQHPAPGYDQNVLTHGNTGKIIGKIIDQKSGEPIPGVNVLVVGTARGASTDLDGKYTIIGIPIGKYTVRSSQVGYGNIEYTNVKIDANVTTPLDFKLQTSNVAIGGVTITAEHLVNNLATSGEQTVNSKSIEKLPDVKTVEDVLKTQAGFVQQGKNLFLRGGRANEVQYFVD